MLIVVLNMLFMPTFTPTPVVSNGGNFVCRGTYENLGESFASCRHRSVTGLL